MTTGQKFKFKNPIYLGVGGDIQEATFIRYKKGKFCGENLIKCLIDNKETWVSESLIITK